MPSIEIKRTLLDEVESRSSEIINLASDLIKIPSENPPGNVDRITEFLVKYLRNMSVDVSLVKGTEGKPNLVCQTGPAQSSRTLLLNGHTDVVPAGSKEGWNSIRLEERSKMVTFMAEGHRI